jgi:hypothetical protein
MAKKTTATKTATKKPETMNARIDRLEEMLTHGLDSLQRRLERLEGPRSDTISGEPPKTEALRRNR